MAKKTEQKVDFGKLLKQYEPAMKKAGEQLSKAMKSAEKDVAKMYRLAETHVEIQMGNLQREKLYYDIGKDVASKISKGGLTEEDLEKYRKRLGKIEFEVARKRKSLSKAGKTAKKK